MFNLRNYLPFIERHRHSVRPELRLVASDHTQRGNDVELGDFDVGQLYINEPDQPRVVLDCDALRERDFIERKEREDGTFDDEPALEEQATRPPDPEVVEILIEEAPGERDVVIDIKEPEGEPGCEHCGQPDTRTCGVCMHHVCYMPEVNEGGRKLMFVCNHRVKHRPYQPMDCPHEGIVCRQCFEQIWEQRRYRHITFGDMPVVQCPFCRAPLLCRPINAQLHRVYDHVTRDMNGRDPRSLGQVPHPRDIMYSIRNGEAVVHNPRELEDMLEVEEFVRGGAARDVLAPIPAGQPAVPVVRNEAAGNDAGGVVPVVVQPAVFSGRHIIQTRHVLVGDEDVYGPWNLYPAWSGRTAVPIAEMPARCVGLRPGGFSYRRPEPAGDIRHRDRTGGADPIPDGHGHPMTNVDNRNVVFDHDIHFADFPIPYTNFLGLRTLFAEYDEYPSEFGVPFYVGLQWVQLPASVVYDLQQWMRGKPHTHEEYKVLQIKCRELLRNVYAPSADLDRWQMYAPIVAFYHTDTYDDHELHRIRDGNYARPGSLGRFCWYTFNVPGLLWRRVRFVVLFALLLYLVVRFGSDGVVGGAYHILRDMGEVVLWVVHLLSDEIHW